MDLTERRLAGRTVFEGRVFSVEVDRVSLPDGREARREVVRHPGGVAVLAVDGEGRVVLVRQFRYGAGQLQLEIPAGRLETGEDPRAAALRELAEETGYRAGRLEPLGSLLPTPAYNSERIWLFWARELTPGQPRPDDGEWVEIELLPMDEAVRRVLAGEMNDAKTVAALLKARLLGG